MIAAVHLVWGPLGPEPLREFLSSYRQHAAGIDHELVVIFNGVRPEHRAPLRSELSGVEHRVLVLAAPVQDLAAYAHAATHLTHDRVCFLNSYSVVLADGWLAKLNAALDEPGAGLVAASGSWMSLQSWQLNIHRLPNRYRGVVPERAAMFEQFQAVERELEQAGNRPAVVAHEQQRSRGGLLRASLKGLPSALEQIARFPRFPAVHLRTNAFMGERALFAGLRVGAVERKMDAYLLESGRTSLTRQAQRKGLRPLVVDREGAIYESERWPQSDTFWQGDQEKLLVADKQTRVYANGGPERRRLLSALAWGRQADPRMPGQ